MNNIPDKYLNNNVRAMVSGGIKDLKKPKPEQQPIFHLNKILYWFAKKYRLDVSIFKEESKGESE